MKKIYFTVGPSEVYPTIYKHLNYAFKNQILSLNHRGQEFKNLFKKTSLGLKKLLNIPNSYQIVFIASALESMERIIQGCCHKTSFHIITGNFGKAWANYAKELGRKTFTVTFSNTDEINFDNLKVHEKAEIICITQNDTSTGIWVPMEQISKLKKKYPDKLIAIDIVSSVPYVDIDFKTVDIAFFSVQKGFGLPAGLAVMVIGPKASEKTDMLIKNKALVGSYHSIKNLLEKAQDYQTPETPNVLNIYLLNAVTEDMLKTGINRIRQDINQKAKVLYDFANKHKIFCPYIKNLKFRSPTTVVIDVKGKSEQLRKRLAKLGYIIGAGYGDNKLNHIRIANFPAHRLKDVKLLAKHI